MDITELHMIIRVFQLIYDLLSSSVFNTFVEKSKKIS